LWNKNYSIQSWNNPCLEWYQGAQILGLSQAEKACKRFLYLKPLFPCIHIILFITCARPYKSLLTIYILSPGCGTDLHKCFWEDHLRAPLPPEEYQTEIQPKSINKKIHFSRPTVGRIVFKEQKCTYTSLMLDKMILNQFQSIICKALDSIINSLNNLGCIIQKYFAIFIFYILLFISLFWGKEVMKINNSYVKPKRI